MTLKIMLVFLWKPFLTTLLIVVQSCSQNQGFQVASFKNRLFFFFVRFHMSPSGHLTMLEFFAKIMQ